MFETCFSLKLCGVSEGECCILKNFQFAFDTDAVKFKNKFVSAIQYGFCRILSILQMEDVYRGVRGSPFVSLSATKQDLFTVDVWMLGIYFLSL